MPVHPSDGPSELVTRYSPIPADGEEGETEAGADGGEDSFELGIPAEREKGEVAAANP